MPQFCFPAGLCRSRCSHRTDPGAPAHPGKRGTTNSSGNTQIEKIPLPLGLSHGVAAPPRPPLGPAGAHSAGRPRPGVLWHEGQPDLGDRLHPRLLPAPARTPRGLAPRRRAGGPGETARPSTQSRHPEVGPWARIPIWGRVPSGRERTWDRATPPPVGAAAEKKGKRRRWTLLRAAREDLGLPPERPERPGWGYAGSEHSGWGALPAAARFHWLPRQGRGLSHRPPPPAASTLAARAAAGLDLAGPRRHEPQPGLGAELPGAAGSAGRPGGGSPRRRVQREWRTGSASGAPRPWPCGRLSSAPGGLCLSVSVSPVSPRLGGSLRVSLPSTSLSLLLSPSSLSAPRPRSATSTARPGRTVHTLVPGVLVALPEQPGCGRDRRGGRRRGGRAALLRWTAPAPPLLAT